jgi:hypothetical protein
MESRRMSAIVALMTATLSVGLARFALTVSEAPDHVARYASMTAVLLVGCLYFGAATGFSKKELLAASYLLILPYMVVELGGIGYTWATGKPTIFQASEFSAGLRVDHHFWAHLLGGLTLEPLVLFVQMLIVRGTLSLWRTPRRIS